MGKVRDLEIIQMTKYLNGELIDSELSDFKIWLENEDNYNLFKEYAVADHYVNLNKDNFDDKKAFLSFIEETKEKKKRLVLFGKPVLNILKYAAVFVGIVFSATLFYRNDTITIDENVVEVTLEMGNGVEKRVITEGAKIEILNESGTVVAVQKENILSYILDENPESDDENFKEVYNTLKVPYGKKFKLVLSDGTEIQLNSGSTIKYPIVFGGKGIRKVVLEGEAFFKVAKNKDKPFVVVTDAISTEVLGTQFNISHYKDDSFSEVVLVEGSVGVFKGKERFDIQKDILLKPNQKVRIDKGRNNMVISDVEVYEYIAWLKGNFVFNNKSFQHIMKKLERHFDIEVEVYYQDIMKQKFTGEFDVEDIESIMNTFKENTPFEFRYINNKLIINK